MRSSADIAPQGQHWYVSQVTEIDLGKERDNCEKNGVFKNGVCLRLGLAVNTGTTNYMEIGRNRGMIANAHIPMKK